MGSVPFEDRICSSCSIPYHGRKNSHLCPDCRKKRNAENCRAWKKAHREDLIIYYRQHYRRKKPTVKQQRDAFPWGKAPGLEWLNELTDRERVLPNRLQGMAGTRLERAIESLANS